MKSYSNFDIMPKDILIIIINLASSDLKNIFSICLVSKKFNDIIKTRTKKWLNSKSSGVLWNTSSYIDVFTMQWAYFNAKDDQLQQKIMKQGLVIDRYVLRHIEKQNQRRLSEIKSEISKSFNEGNIEEYGLVRYFNGQTIIHHQISLLKTTDKTINLVNQSFIDGSYRMSDFDGRNILDYIRIYWRTSKFHHQKLIFPDEIQRKRENKKNNIIEGANSGNIRNALDNGWEDDIATLLALIDIDNNKNEIPEICIKNFSDIFEEVFGELKVQNTKALNWVQEDGSTRLQRIILQCLIKLNNSNDDSNLSILKSLKQTIMPYVDIDLRDSNGNTTLMYLFGRYIVNSKDTMPNTYKPKNILSVAQVLVDHGANINAVNLDGEPIIHQMIKASKLDNELLMFFVKNRANINIQNDNMDTALMLSFEKQCQENLSLMLLENGADPTIKNNKNKIGLHYAARNGNYRSVGNILTKFPKIIDHQDSYGSTALHLCLYRMQDKKSDAFIKTLEKLLDCGANTNIQNNALKKPIHIVMNATPNTNNCKLYNQALELLQKAQIRGSNNTISHS